MISVLDEKDRDFGDIRRVLERGMKNGAVSLMKDVRRSRIGSIDFMVFAGKARFHGCTAVLCLHVVGGGMEDMLGLVSEMCRRYLGNACRHPNRN